MKIRFDFKSIRFRIWVYFLILAVLILALVWFLQVYFMKEYYEEMKMREVTSMSNAFTTAYNNDDESLADSIRNMSVTNDYYFMMEYGGQLLTFQPDSEVTKPVYTYQRLVPNLKDALSTSEGGDHASVKFSAGPEDYYVLGYVKILETVDANEEPQETEEEPDNNVYLYIFTPLYPVDSTVHILQGQLTLITVMALVVAFILALLFSRRLSRPIKAITSEARKLGDGDFNVKFQGKSYSEVNRLAETLNTAAYEMAQADNRQKDLIANVSHDLKTPLTLIRSYAEMIRDLSGDDPVKRNANLEVIMEESDRMSNLISDMSKVSRMARHETKLDMEYFDLVQLTAEILTSYDIYVTRDGYDFIFNAPKEASVYADRDNIAQVLTNLISNAVKYCGEDKTVIVNIRKAGKVFRVEVSDHGPGIKQEEIPHVWDRYYKASSNYVRPTKGSGLGLSIVKEILTLHKAEFGVVSQEGEGSTFWFELDMMKRN